MPSYKKEIDREQALAVANRIAASLHNDGIRCMICGSVRRGLPTVRDVDMVIQHPADLADQAIASACNKFDLAYELKSSRVTAERKSFDCLVEGIQFNILITVEESWGAAIMHYTGSQFFNIMIRGRAKKLGYKLNEKGLWHRDEMIAGRSEDGIFNALMIKYMSPEDRSLKYGNYLPVDGPIGLKEDLNKEA